MPRLKPRNGCTELVLGSVHRGAAGYRREVWLRGEPGGRVAVLCAGSELGEEPVSLP